MALHLWCLGLAAAAADYHAAQKQRQPEIAPHHERRLGLGLVVLQIALKMAAFFQEKPPEGRFFGAVASAVAPALMQAFAVAVWSHYMIYVATGHEFGRTGRANVRPTLFKLAPRRSSALSSRCPLPKPDMLPTAAVTLLGTAIAVHAAAAAESAAAPQRGTFFSCEGLSSSWECADDLAAEAVLREAERALHLSGADAPADGGLLHCNIDAIDAAKLGWTADEWPSVFKRAGLDGRPLLVRNPPSALFELLPELTHKATLLEVYGSETLRVRDSSPFTVMWGLDSSVDAKNLRLRDVVGALGKLGEVFSLVATSMHELFPRLFSDHVEMSVSLGLPGTGLTFHHAHGQAFLGLLAGKKRWYFYPPEEVPAAELQWGKTWNWIRQAAAGRLNNMEVQSPPTVCTQLPGEIMIVPRVWWHATLNGPGQTFALGTQEPVENMDGEAADAIRRTSVHSLNSFLQTKDYAGAEARARELLALNPAELPVHGSLAQLLVFRDATQEAQAHMDAVVKQIEGLTDDDSQPASQNASSAASVPMSTAQHTGLLEPQDAAFALLRLAISMTNVGLNAKEPVLLALGASPEGFFPQSAVTKLLHALGKRLDVCLLS